MTGSSLKPLVRFCSAEQAVFTNGRLGFDARTRPLLLLLIALLIGVFLYWVYIRPRAHLLTRTTAALVALRASLLILIALLLLRPVIVVSSVIPRSSHVAVIIDNSLSMTLKDMPGGASRLDAVKQTLIAPPSSGKSSFLTRLEEKFKTNLYEFSGTLSNLKSARIAW